MTPKELPRDFKMAQHGTKEDPRGARSAPYLAKDGSQRAPRTPIEAQREPNMAKDSYEVAPGSAQEGSRWPQEGPKDAHRCEKSSQESPTSASPKH